MGVNKVILLGNLGKDPELRYTQSQTPVCTFSLATGEKRKDPSGNGWVDHTEWHNLVAFGKTAETCSNYLKKGRQVYVEGKIQTRKWQDKEGKDRYTTEVLINTVQFVGSARGEGQGAAVARNNGAAASANSGAAEAVIADAAINNSSSAPGEVTFDDDDIPF